jgi:hypothetical protein
MSTYYGSSNSNRSPPPPRYVPGSFDAKSPGPPGQAPSSSPHVRSPGPAKDHGDLFPTVSARWRDLWAALLFYAHFAAIVGLFGWMLVKARGEDWFAELFSSSSLATSPTSSSGSNILQFSAFEIAWCVGVAVVAFAMSFVMLGVMRFAPRTSIILSYWGNAGLTLGIAIYAFVAAQIVAGIFGLISGLLLVLLYFLWRRHIPLSAELMRTVSTVALKYPGTIVATVLDALVASTYVVFWLSTSFLAYQLAKEGQMSIEARNGLFVYLVFSFYWTSQVIANVLHTIISGIMATFFFVEGSGAPVGNPAAASASRALTWSFGSVCFGSLLVALIQLVRFLLRSATDRDSIAGAIVDCLLGILEGLTKYFNYYAYIYVAIYGKPYLESAKATWQLIKSHGVDAIINDNLVGTTCGLFALMGALLTGLVTFLVYQLVYRAKDIAVIMAFLSSVIALLLVSLLLSIVSSGSSATFVCLAEDPAALKRSKPDLYAALTRAYSHIFAQWYA